MEDRIRTCGRCGHRWSCHTETPVRCPSCGTYHWNGNPTTYVCISCGHRWFSRTDSIPLRCPKCRTRCWREDRTTSGPGSRTERHDPEMSERILGMYGSNMGCMDISIATDVPLSTVISVIKAELKLEKMPRM